MMELISNAQARTITADWHGGQSSAMYAFCSTGAIRWDLEREIHGDMGTDQAGEPERLRALLRYVLANTPPRGDDEDAPEWDRGPVDGWSDGWDETLPTLEQIGND